MEGRQEKKGVDSREATGDEGFGCCIYGSATYSAALDVFVHTQNCVAH